LLLVALAAATYIGVRALTEGSVATAVGNGKHLLDVEHRLGIAWEEGIQEVVLPHAWLVTFANWIYIWGHWPVIVVAAVALYRWRYASYRLLRNAVFLSGAVGFLFFALVPVAPPRLLENGLVDTVVAHSRSYRALQPPALTNQYAAFPSLHFGWNLLVGIVLFTAFTAIVIRVFAVLMPLAMGLAVVATANHFVVDVLAGGVIVLAALFAAHLVAARSSRTLRRNARDRHDGERAVRGGAPRRQRPSTASPRRVARHHPRRG
jgi:hypothetical protein